MSTAVKRQPFEMLFDISTIKHLGLQMYSTLPPVIGELVSNAWDADAEEVKIVVPTSVFNDQSEILIEDDGDGMRDDDVRKAYLIIGRDRRQEQQTPLTSKGRPIMGRKGIGKFSAFGIAGEIEVETIRGGQNSRFVMNLSDLQQQASKRKAVMPILPPTGKVTKGSKVTLRRFTKYHSRAVSIDGLRRGLARRFSIIGPAYKFDVKVNGSSITPQERDLKRLLDRDENGKKYLWEFKDVEIREGSGWKVNGWIGALDRTEELEDGIQRGIVLMARGKLVQEPFVFEAIVGQQFALSYLVGKIHAEFVDDLSDTVNSVRTSLVWDTEANAALKEWYKQTVNRISREWAERRAADNEKQLAENPLYKKFQAESEQFEDRLSKRAADKLIREVVTKNPLADVKEQQGIIQMAIDFMEFDAFKEMASELEQADVTDVPKIINLFRDWEVIEAKEMMRVTEGRIKTIEKLQQLIDENALEVPTLHKFLKEFPWVLDPRWALIADEVTYSQLLRNEFPEPANKPENEKRIDFLCVRESNNLVVVEIKRPKLKASMKELGQIEEYVGFMREHVKKTTDVLMQHNNVVGYLLCGDLVDTGPVRQKRDNLAKADIWVRRYEDLLRMVKDNHKEFLQRYEKLRKAKRKAKAAAK